MNAALGPDAVVSRAGHLIADLVAGDTVIHDPVQDTYLFLNPTGTAIWDGLERPASVTDLSQTLVQRFGVDRDRALNDTVTFLTELQGRRLIELAA